MSNNERKTNYANFLKPIFGGLTFCTIVSAFSFGIHRAYVAESQTAVNTLAKAYAAVIAQSVAGNASDQISTLEQTLHVHVAIPASVDISRDHLAYRLTNGTQLGAPFSKLYVYAEKPSHELIEIAAITSDKFLPRPM